MDGPLHLWAQIRTALPPDEVASSEFLGKEMPPPRLAIVGMVIENQEKQGNGNTGEPDCKPNKAGLLRSPSAD
jgi:hypothetical protein